jgi:AICAR transformylase/IMP cyclohydrolase PurH
LGRPWHDRQTSRHSAGLGAELGGHSAAGSIKDEEFIAAANEHGMAMIFTG